MITGFVEPVPALYGRLSTLLGVMERGLTKFLSSKQLKKIDVHFGLAELKRMVAKLDVIARKELENKRLSKKEYELIRDFGVTSETLLSTVVKGSGPKSYTYDVGADALKTTLVADVHTDGNQKACLEEGTGYLRWMVAACTTSSDMVFLAVGPVLSYYEFKQPMGDRLTDEKWRELLDGGQNPAEPSWTASFCEP